MATTQKEQEIKTPEVHSITPEELAAAQSEGITQLREELEDYHTRCFQLTDALTELLYLIHGIELIDHYVDDNCLQLPEDREDLNACAALKEAANAQIKSDIGAMITLASGEACCIEL